MQSPKQPSLSLDRDGTARAQEVVFPLSSLVSPAFNQAHRDLLDRVAHALPPVPAQDAPKAEWAEFDRLQNRWNVELLVQAKARYAVAVEETEIAGVPAAVVTPQTGVTEKNRQRALINLRGGGFIANRGLLFGQLESIPVAAIGGFKVITLDYRQAPHHFFPAGSEDVAAVYQELLRTHSPQAIGIYGCSAGGLLTAQSLAWMAAKGLPRPGAAGVLSMSLSAPSRAQDQFHQGGDSAIWGAVAAGPPPEYPEALLKMRTYMGAADREDPLAWPGASDAVLARFPPTLFLVGTREGFMSTAVVDHARMIRLGVEASLYIMEGALHATHVVCVETPEAHDANLAIARFFDRHLSSG